MAALHLWLDPKTGHASESEHAGWWRIIRDDDTVSILGESGTLIGSGRWSGSGIKKRYAVDEPITNRTWGKIEHALRKGPHDVRQPDRPVPWAESSAARSTTAHSHTARTALVDLRSGAVVDGRDPSSDEVRITIDGDHVSILDHAGCTATARWDGTYLGKREPSNSVLYSDAAAWKVVEQAVHSLMSGQEVGRTQRITPAPAAGFVEATVQSMTGEILERRDAPSEGPVAELFHWRITLAGDRVTLVDHVGTATARWDGKALDQRDANDSTLSTNAERWTTVERVVSTLAAEQRAASPETESDFTDEAARRETRSGWWALGAAAIAIAGTIVSGSAMQPGDTVGIVITIALAVLALGLVIYTLYGATTRCPSCKAWYRRETTSVEDLGSSTFTRQESKPVYDSSGKETGTTYETVTIRRTDYRYNYRCKECSNHWTGAGSSESRV